MASNSSLPQPSSFLKQPLSGGNPYSQLRLQREGNRLLLILPSQAQIAIIDWLEFTQTLKHRLTNREKTWQPGTEVHLLAQNHLLDTRQLQTVAQTLKQFALNLKLVATSRRQTAVAAATSGYSVQQQVPHKSLTQKAAVTNSELAEPLYLQATIRSGVEIRHPGTVIVWGDVNPGANVIANGDILVWGRLRGVVHAGAEGNRECKIMALQMEPTQLRIADVLARAPETKPAEFKPEVAYIATNGICLTKAIDFLKQYHFVTKMGVWQDLSNQSLIN